jgi:biotin carboxylase/SAM-dependent methyltransferase
MILHSDHPGAYLSPSVRSGPGAIEERIREAIALRRCVPVIGAGASIAANGPTWKEYLDKMAAGLPVQRAQLEHLDPVDAASWLRAERLRLGLPPVRVGIAGDTQVHRVLAAWGCPVYVTTNFDDGIERALGSVGRYRCHLNDQLESLDLSTPGDPVVIKLCSSSREFNPGAITREDFAELLHRDTAAAELLLTLLRCYTVVFVGCGMRDPLIRQALDRAHVAGLGHGRHAAFVTHDFPLAYESILGTMGVDCVRSSMEDRTAGLLETLERCKSTFFGMHQLILFEPGTEAKLRRVMEEIRDCADLDVGRLAIVTEAEELARLAMSLSSVMLPKIKVDIVRSPNLADSQRVLQELATLSTSWNAILVPYEYAVGSAAEFAEQWSVAHRRLRFHSVKTAETSRDKRKFRQAMASDRGNRRSRLRPIAHETISLDDEPTAAGLFELVRAAASRLDACRLVVKPPDAAGSIGVRSIDLNDERSARSAIGDLVNILASMPVTDETARCQVSELIVERRIEGEEFSVESVCVNGDTEPLAIHWKVDIDSDQTRFFERLFVTLPPNLPSSEQLIAANRELLTLLGVGAGVFHAEYRLDPDGTGIYPLEVGLRPGGGMVSSSVRASRGVDLFSAAIRCALKAPQVRPSKQDVVATGLVFAKQPGVLPPLAVRDGKTKRSVSHDDAASVREWLRRFLRNIERDRAGQALREVVTRSNALCQDVLSNFDETAANGRGLRVDLREVQLLQKPGSLVTEEEACYVAGVLVVADPALEPIEAVAETVAAMQLCLSTFVCEPSEQLAAIRWRSSRVREFPTWWARLSTAGFSSDMDSWTFARAIERHCEGRAFSMLDLGCGSARPAIRAVQRGCTYHGIDISARAVSEARGNLARHVSQGWDVSEADVLEDSVLGRVQGHSWDLIVANLPYLPAPPGLFTGDEAREVDGGADGLRFIPRIIELATRLRAGAIIVNTSSLCDLGCLSRQLEAAALGVHRVVATLAPLESYACRARDYLRSADFSRIFGAPGSERQIIYAVELRHGEGIPFGMMVEQAEAVLRPELNQVGTMAVGVSSW